jgi:chemotaxis protein methyltransferase CheR
MRSSIPDRSSLFLLRGPRQAGNSDVSYILPAEDTALGAAKPTSDFWELGLGLQMGRRRRLATALSQEITTDQPGFLGDTDGLAALVSHVLPVLIQSRRYSRSLRIWSAGCATGQAAYGLAIAIAECCPALANWNVEIVASDADADALARARSGTYSSHEVQSGLPSEWLLRHFDQLSPGGGWQFRAQPRRRLTWLRLDLADSCQAVGAVDIVVCYRGLERAERDHGSRQRLFRRLTGQLASDGFLILKSPAEGTDLGAGFQCLRANEAAVYRRLPSESSLLSA